MHNIAMISNSIQGCQIGYAVHEILSAEKKYELTKITVPPHGIGWFDDYSIEIKGQSDGEFEGQIECRLEYGKPGRLNNVLDINKKVFFQFNDKGDIERFDQ